MKTFSIEVKCDTATELMEALLNMYNTVNKDADKINKMQVDNSLCLFGGIPSYELTRIE